MDGLHDFPPFPLGTVRSPLRTTPARVREPAKRVSVRYPTRLNAMALDSSKVLPGGDGYPAGELLFTCPLWRTVEVNVQPGDPGIPGIEIVAGSSHAAIAEHAARITCEALGLRMSLQITVQSPDLPSHIGLGSSSATMAAVATAVTQLAGLSVPARDLIRFLAENHGEEIDADPRSLLPVQCLGGSAAAGLIPGAVQVLAGRSTPVLTSTLPEDLAVILAFPQRLRRWDAAASLAAEALSFDGFARTGRQHGHEIAYRLLHEAWPAMIDGDLKPIGQLLFDYRFRMGSIENCAFSHPDLKAIAAAIEPVFLDGLADVLSLSSVGPLFFAISRDASACAAALGTAGLQTITTELWNHGHQTELEG